jgi:hypothetical protein
VSITANQIIVFLICVIIFLLLWIWFGRERHGKVTGHPIHTFFELSYANYLALPRSILQSMPAEWQARLVRCIDELDVAFNWRRSGCFVNFRNRKGRFIEDTLGDYGRGRRILTPEEVDALVRAHNKKYAGGPK